jgi:hypothetical protein
MMCAEPRKSNLKNLAIGCGSLIEFWPAVTRGPALKLKVEEYIAQPDNVLFAWEDVGALMAKAMLDSSAKEPKDG